MKGKQRVAIFDIDGTIFRSSLLIELVAELIRMGAFPRRAEKVYATSREEWLDRQGEYEPYIDAVVAAFVKHIRGVKYPVYRQAIDTVIAAHQHRVYRFTRDLVRDLKKKGYFVLAISNSPREAVAEFCKTLGFSKVYSRIYELDEKKEKFTGRVLYPELVADKAKLLKRAVAKSNLTLAGSVGVGDTESDIAFLKMVARPICFNPNAKLYAAARRRGWRVVVERKDVIYTIR